MEKYHPNEGIRLETENKMNLADYDLGYTKAIIMIPYKRNAHFVGRKDIFDELDGIFTSAQDSQPKAALCGLGGVG